MQKQQDREKRDTVMCAWTRRGDVHSLHADAHQLGRQKYERSTKVSTHIFIPRNEAIFCAFFGVVARDSCRHIALQHNHVNKSWWSDWRRIQLIKHAATLRYTFQSNELITDHSICWLFVYIFHLSFSEHLIACTIWHRTTRPLSIYLIYFEMITSVRTLFPTKTTGIGEPSGSHTLSSISCFH